MVVGLYTAFSAVQACVNCMAELVVFQTGSRLYSLRRVRSLAVMLMSLTDEREFVADK